MNYRYLGNSELKVSEIGFGCMSLDPGSSNKDLLLKAFDEGINYFDTADLYDKGANELLVGEALREVRDGIVLATKVGNEWLADGSGWRWNPRKEYILKAVDQSLNRLQTDYIDVYQLHGGTIEDPIDEVIEAFELLKEQGKIRHYGLSSIRPNVINAYTDKSDIVAVMMQYSLLDRRPEDVFPMIKASQTSVVCRGVLAKGLLLDKPAREYLGYSIGEVDKMKSALESCENPIGEILGFTLEEQVVGSNVIGIRTETQLDTIISGYKAGWMNVGPVSEVLEAKGYDQHLI